MLMLSRSEVTSIYFISISLVETIYIVKYKISFTLDPGSTCPVTFTLNPSINLCYHVVEITMLWLDAKGHCEAMGARLAVLDTPGKLDAIFIGYFCSLIVIK